MMLGALQRESLLAMTSGLIIWSLYFLFCYAFLSLGCALGFAAEAVAGVNLIHLVLLIATALSLILILFLAFRSWRQKRMATQMAQQHEPEGVAMQAEVQRRRRFMSVVALSVHGISVVAVLWVAVPVLLRIPPCQ